jgi:hypothetical protein
LRGSAVEECEAFASIQMAQVEKKFLSKGLAQPPFKRDHCSIKTTFTLSCGKALCTKNALQKHEAAYFKNRTSSRRRRTPYF